MGCVYLITSPSGNQYVGMTTRTVEERCKEHVKRARSGTHDYLLYRAINKHGFGSMTTEILHESTDVDILNELEILEIESRGTYCDGYNMTRGGAGTSVDWSEESRQKARDARAAYFSDPEKRASFDAMIQSEEWRNAVSEGVRNTWANASEEYREYRRKRWAEGQIGSDYRHPEEVYQRLREAAKAANIRRWKDPKNRERMSKIMADKWSDPKYRELMRKTVHSDEANARRAATMRKNYEDPAFHKKVSEQITAMVKSTEFREARRLDMIERTSDPAWKAKAAERMNERYRDPLEREKVSKRSKKAWADPSFRDRMLKAKAAQSKPVSVKGVEYPSCNEADSRLGLCHGSTRYRARSKLTQWSEWKEIQ